MQRLSLPEILIVESLRCNRLIFNWEVNVTDIAARHGNDIRKGDRLAVLELDLANVVNLSLRALAQVCGSTLVTPKRNTPLQRPVVSAIFRTTISSKSIDLLLNRYRISKSKKISGSKLRLINDIQVRNWPVKFGPGSQLACREKMKKRWFQVLKKQRYFFEKKSSHKCQFYTKGSFAINSYLKKYKIESGCRCTLNNQSSGAVQEALNANFPALRAKMHTFDTLFLCCLYAIYFGLIDTAITLKLERVIGSHQSPSNVKFKSSEAQDLVEKLREKNMKIGRQRWKYVRSFTDFGNKQIEIYTKF
uniref:Uncharacterized protein n=1 Tax=Romanomermis culicivorax TaxID=13658 RepID=A0A915JJA2_ROMCU